MKNKWDKIWENKKINIFNSTSFDIFAEKAFSKFGEWISKEDYKILEAGFGTGRYCIALSEKFKSSQVFGIDNSRSACELAREGARIRNITNINFIQGDIFFLPFKDNCVNVVFNDGVLEHFLNYFSAFGEMIRVAKSNGKIIVCVPNWFCFPHTFYKKIRGKNYEYGYEKSFRHFELKQLFSKFNLKNVEISGFNPLHSIGRYNKHLNKLLQVTIGLIIIDSLDKITDGYISKKFGFEICAKGIKKN